MRGDRSRKTFSPASHRAEPAAPAGPKRHPQTQGFGQPGQGHCPIGPRAPAHPSLRQHYLREVANALVKTHDRIAMENLNIGMMRNHQLAGAIADAAWAELARILTLAQRGAC
jgi:hypothetical protein